MGRKNLLALVAVFSFVLSAPALAQSHAQLVERYTALAGSKQNADSLVRGLREGDSVTLSRWNGSVMFIPPTGKMGYGNVDHALALAQAALAQHGITSPTPDELARALMGGNVVTARNGTVALDGVLKMRLEGKGWGQIAQSYGVKLGEVKRPERPEQAARAERVSSIERPGKPERPGIPERPEKTR
jgi:hypothetical protein